jgi:hypothetical protein
MDGDIIFYQFSRPLVERGDFSHFLSLYAPDKLPSGRRLRELMNTLLFAIESYDDDPRELHAIPEVRRFYSAFHAAWPYWLYFCNLDTEILRVMVLCCLPSLAALQVDGRQHVTVEFDRLELLQFLSADFAAMHVMCARAQLFERLIYDRTQQVFAYFALPFHAAPPP